MAVEPVNVAVLRSLLWVRDAEGVIEVWLGDGGGGGVGVGEVGSGFSSAHGYGSAVVGAGGLLRRVEGAQPAALLGVRVPYLGSVTAPRPAADSTVPYGGAGGGASISQDPLGGALLVTVVVGVGVVGVLDRGHSVETAQCFFHDVMM